MKYAGLPHKGRYLEDQIERLKRMSEDLGLDNIRRANAKRLIREKEHELRDWWRPKA